MVSFFVLHWTSKWTRGPQKCVYGDRALAFSQRANPTGVRTSQETGKTKNGKYLEAYQDRVDRALSSRKREVASMYVLIFSRGYVSRGLHCSGGFSIADFDSLWYIPHLIGKMTTRNF